ncbi:hypothetical protein, partial [Kineococcus glutinatus]|uniref:hypothetical protein n=1 Tax=Kineococcus glutinatus TaxID=1070872 RepID=UPI0031E66F93
LVRRLAAACAAQGLQVRTGAGVGLVVDLLVAAPPAEGVSAGDVPRWERGALAVELDGADPARVGGVRERDRGRPEELERAGWYPVRSCGADVLADPRAEAGRIARLWREHVGGAPAAGQVPGGADRGADRGAGGRMREVGR